MQKKFKFVRLEGNNLREANGQKWKQSKQFSSNLMQK